MESRGDANNTHAGRAVESVRAVSEAPRAVRPASLGVHAAGDSVGPSSRAARAALDDPRVRGAVLGTILGLVAPTAVIARFVDPRVAQWCETHDFSWGENASLLGLAQCWLAPALVVLLVAALLRRANVAQWSFLLVASIVVSGVVVNVVKLATARPRPSWSALTESTFAWNSSFPSGHVTTVASAATLLVLLRPRCWPLAALPVVVVGAARIVDQGHYVSDVLAGAVLGASTTLGLQWIWARIRPLTAPGRRECVCDPLPTSPLAAADSRPDHA